MVGFATLYDIFLTSKDEVNQPCKSNQFSTSYGIKKDTYPPCFQPVVPAGLLQWYHKGFPSAIIERFSSNLYIFFFSDNVRLMYSIFLICQWFLGLHLTIQCHCSHTDLTLNLSNNCQILEIDVDVYWWLLLHCSLDILTWDIYLWFGHFCVEIMCFLFGAW